MPTVQQNLGLSDEQFGKLRLFNRILISYNDFAGARDCGLILDGDLYRNYPTENLVLVIALNMAAVVAYSRPFISGVISLIIGYQVECFAFSTRRNSNCTKR